MRHHISALGLVTSFFCLAVLGVGCLLTEEADLPEETGAAADAVTGAPAAFPPTPCPPGVCDDGDPCTVDMCFGQSSQQCFHVDDGDKQCFDTVCASPGVHTLVESVSGTRLVQCDAQDIFWLDNEGSVRGPRGRVVEHAMAPMAVAFRFNEYAFYTGTAGSQGVLSERTRLWGGSPATPIALTPGLTELVLDADGTVYYTTGTSVESLDGLGVAPASPSGLAKIGNVIYWTDMELKSVRAFNAVTAGEPYDLTFSGVLATRTLAADGSSLYVGGRWGGVNQLRRMNIDGLGGVALSSELPGMTAATKEFVAWSDGHGLHAAHGNVAHLISGATEVTGLAICGKYMVWSDGAGTIRCATPPSDEGNSN